MIKYSEVSKTRIYIAHNVEINLQCARCLQSRPILMECIFYSNKILHSWYLIKAQLW